MFKKKGSRFIAFGAALILIAAGLAAYNVYDSWHAEKASEEVYVQLSDAMEGNSVENGVINPNRDMPTEEIDGYLYIGVLEIPALKLKLPVMEEWDYTRLRISPCRYEGSAYKDNMIIAGHNYSSHFGNLDQLPTGARVRFTDVEGNVFDYTLKWVDILEPEQTEEMLEGDWDLSLFTCTYDLSRRNVLRCVKDINRQSL